MSEQRPPRDRTSREEKVRQYLEEMRDHSRKGRRLGLVTLGVSAILVGLTVAILVLTAILVSRS